MAVPLLTRPVSQDTGLARFARQARNNRLDAVAQEEYGYALLTSGHIDESVEWLEHAVNLQPKNPAFHTNLAAALHQVGKWEVAFAHARIAQELDPAGLKNLLNVAGFHYWFGEVEEAICWYDRALEVEPRCWQAWWMRLFMLDFLPISAERALEERKRFADAFETPLKPRWPKHRNDPDPDRRLRIGLTGGDFRQHSSSYCWGPIFEHMDRDRYWIFSYAHQTQVDPLTGWFEKASNGWRDVSQCYDDRYLADQIMRDEIDVLIDLGTFSENSHLMAHLYKPAPVQMTAWGHLTGAGLSSIDALLVDRVMVPPGTEWEMVERPAYVPVALGWYSPNDPKDLLPIPPRHERPLTFGYLGRIQKLDDPTVALWADILHAYPESRLILKDVAYLQERASTRTLERFEAWGIDPTRIELRNGTDRDTHLRTYWDVDVALDPLPQSGGATTNEALMMGVPTVTLRGERLVRRVSAGTLTAAGFPDWIAEDVHQYVELAGRLVNERGPAIREQFLASVVCDGKARTRAFEDAVRDLWRGWCRDETYRRACEL